MEEQNEVRHAVTIDILSDKEDDTGLDEMGSSEPREWVLWTSSQCLWTLVLWVLQRKISEHIMKERLYKLKRYITKWLYVQGVPFNAIDCEEFDRVQEAAGRFGPGAKKPYQHELKEKLLHEEVEDTKELLKDQEQEWVKTGCSIMTDAWRDQKRRSVTNLCVNCTIGTTFLESREASAESHTGELIFQYVDSGIEKVGADKVVQVVTDNASNNMAAKQMMYIKRPNIFWSGVQRTLST